MWTFFCYDNGDEVNLWQAWYDGASAAVQAAHDYALDFLEVRENHEWHNTPHFGELVPNKGIYEIRIPGSVKWRVAGYFTPGRQFTVVLVCNHKQQVYSPRDAKKTCVKRKNGIESG